VPIIDVKDRPYDPAQDPSNPLVAPPGSEYERAVSGGKWGAAMMIVGALVSASAQVVQIATSIDARAGLYAGAVLAILGIVYRGWLDARLMESRSRVKVASITGAANIAVAKITGKATPGQSGATTTTETTTQTGGSG
jgi:hypothetical protein